VGFATGLEEMKHRKNRCDAPTMIAALNGAFDDISKAIRLHRVWVALAHEDIGDQHSAL
jgi:hypothetical protein